MRPTSDASALSLCIYLTHGFHVSVCRCRPLPRSVAAKETAAPSVTAAGEYACTETGDLPPPPPPSPLPSPLLHCFMTAAALHITRNLRHNWRHPPTHTHTHVQAQNGAITPTPLTITASVSVAQQARQKAERTCGRGERVENTQGENGRGAEGRSALMRPSRRTSASRHSPPRARGRGPCAAEYAPRAAPRCFWSPPRHRALRILPSLWAQSTDRRR